MTEWSSLLESLYVPYCMYQELQLFLLSVTQDIVLILKYFFCSMLLSQDPRLIYITGIRTKCIWYNTLVLTLSLV